MKEVTMRPAGFGLTGGTGTKEIRLSNSQQNNLWPKIDKLLKTNNPETHNMLTGDAIPTKDQLAKMFHYPMVMGTNATRVNGSYEAYFDGQNTYIADISTRIGETRKVTWHLLVNFAMPTEAEKPRIM